MSDGSAHYDDPAEDDLAEDDAAEDDAGDGEDASSRDAAILDELAELGLALARGLQQKALAAEAPQDAAALAAGFQRVARTVRQCLALKGKLARDDLQMGRQMHRDAQVEIDRRIRRRKAWVRMYLERTIAEQTPEGDVDLARCRLEDLRERLDDEVLDEGFLAADLPELLAWFCRELGLRPPSRTGEAARDDLAGDLADQEAAPADPDPPAVRASNPPPPEPWQANGRLAPPLDPPSWETG